MNRTLAAMLIGATALLTACSAESGLAVDQQSAPVIQEDDPGWDCATMGNLICGDPAHVYAAEAWAGWDATPDAWDSITIDADAYRVEYVGYASRTPLLEQGMAAVPMGPDASQRYYLFRAVPTATTPAPINALD